MPQNDLGILLNDRLCGGLGMFLGICIFTNTCGHRTRLRNAGFFFFPFCLAKSYCFFDSDSPFRKLSLAACLPISPCHGKAPSHCTMGITAELSLAVPKPLPPWCVCVLLCPQHQAEPLPGGGSGHMSVE